MKQNLIPRTMLKVLVMLFFLSQFVACRDEEAAPPALEEMVFFGSVEDLVPLDALQGKGDAAYWIIYNMNFLHDWMLGAQSEFFHVDDTFTTTGALKNLPDSLAHIRSIGYQSNENFLFIGLGADKSRQYFWNDRFLGSYWGWQKPDQSEGFLGENRIGDLYTYSWTRKPSTLIITMSGYDVRKMVLVINRVDHSGKLIYDWYGSPLEEITWDSNGNGTWKTIENGEVIDSGEF